MAYIRKHYKKWQAHVRKKNIRVIKSFWKKSDATNWAYRTEAQIETGSFNKIKKEERLNEIKLSQLLDIFFDKTKSKSKNVKRFEYEVNHIKRSTKQKFIVSGKLKNQYMETAKLITYPNRRRRPLHFMKQIIIFARETLMRQGELFNLKEQDVDFFGGTALIRETKNDTPRKIGLSPLAMEQLKSLPTSIDGRFFPIKNRHAFDGYFRLVCRDAKIDFNFHQLRHMGANDLIKSG